MITSEEFNSLMSGNALSVDIETYDPDLMEYGPTWVRNGSSPNHKDGYITGVAFANADTKVYIPVRHPELSEEEQKKNIGQVKQLLETKSLKIGANFQYDYGWLKSEGYTINGKIADVQFAEPLIDEAADSFSLKSLTKKYLGEESQKRTDLIENWCIDHGIYENFGGHIHELPLSIVTEYAKADADVTLKVLRMQWPTLVRQDLMNLFEMENKLIPLLVDMRKRGVRVNYPKLEEITYAAVNGKNEMQERVRQMLDVKDLDVGSVKQLTTICHQLGFPLTRKKPTKLMQQAGKEGNLTLDNGALMQWINLTDPMRNGYNLKELGQLIQAYRRLGVTVNLFCKSYLKFGILWGENNFRLHASFHPLKKDSGQGGEWGRGTGTVSGRFSSSEPNLQQVTSRSEESEYTPEVLKGKAIRNLFEPEEGCDWVKMDYSQMEYRLMAHFAIKESGKAIQKAYNENPNLDIHQYTCEMTGLSRQKAKMVNFACSYGIRDFTLATMLGISQPEAKEMLDAIKLKSPFINVLRTAIEGVANPQTGLGYVKTIGGRWQRASNKRPYWTLFNGMMQGSCADFMKKSMVECMEAGIFDVCPIMLTVHDEMDLSVPRTKEARQAVEEGCRIMERVYKCNVPIVVEPEFGTTWGNVKPEEKK